MVNVLFVKEQRTLRCAYDLEKSGPGEIWQAARIQWRIQALIFEIFVRTGGRLDSKAPKFRAAQSSFKASFMRKELSSLEKWKSLPWGRPCRNKIMVLVSRRGLSCSLLINVDTQLHTGDTRLRAQKAWEILVRHSQSAPGLKVRPRFHYGVWCHFPSSY